MTETETIHATTVAIAGRGVLIEGASGSGKSDLALRLIDRGATLIADDRTIVTRIDDAIEARCPATIAGRIEVRGLGIVAMAHADSAVISLAATLGEPVARMPDPEVRSILGVAVPMVRIDAREASAPIKLELAFARGGDMTVQPSEILLVTGLSGAGQSTALKTLEDLGWEVVDNLPLPLLDRLLSAPPPEGAGRAARPLALGIGARTRDFDPTLAIELVEQLRAEGQQGIGMLYLDCAGRELERRYAETRRRHPLAQDLPAHDGIERERALMEPLRRAADRLIDTTRLSANELAQQMRAAFSRSGLSEPTLSVMSFGFARGVPGHADLVFDMRYLRNPHWDPTLKPGTGLDPDVAAYVAADPAYAESVRRIEDLLLLLIPRYHAEGKAYVTVAIGCTGGRHRSVHVADRIAARLRAAGFSPTVAHRDLAAVPQDAIEGRPQGSMTTDMQSR